jgi:murein DD-endopeptidase MepM/ murein hydrolase activator NlpD
MVLIEYSHEWATLYAHLDTVNVRAGQIVQIGDPIGGMGRTGDATGIHLHFELLHKKIPTDPLHFLSRSRRFAGLK